VEKKFDKQIATLKSRLNSLASGIENLTQEEKIKSFISSVSNDSLRAVLLTSIDRNLIEVTC